MERLSKSVRRCTPMKAAHTPVSIIPGSTETVNHGAGEYVREDVTTNGIESVFAVLKRGLIGVYHHASPKHLDRYVDEFSFRLNEGKVKNHTFVRLDSFVDGTARKATHIQGAHSVQRRRQRTCQRHSTPSLISCWRISRRCRQ
jgi:hypothetical protein